MGVEQTGEEARVEGKCQTGRAKKETSCGASKRRIIETVELAKETGWEARESNARNHHQRYKS